MKCENGMNLSAGIDLTRLLVAMEIAACVIVHDRDAESARVSCSNTVTGEENEQD